MPIDPEVLEGKYPILDGKYPSGVAWWGFNVTLPDGQRDRSRFPERRAAEVHRLWLLKKFGDEGMSAAELIEFQEAQYLLKGAGHVVPITTVVAYYLKMNKKSPEKTLSEYSTAYQARKIAKGKRPKTLKELARYLDHFVSMFGHQSPSEVTWDVLHTYLANHSSRWHRDKAIRQFFAWLAGESKSLAALPDFPLERSPFVHIDRPVPVKKADTTILYVDEVKQLIAAAVGTDQLAWVVWGLFSGCRPEAEARSMWADPERAWRQIDLEMCTATITSSKLQAGNTRQLVIQPNLVKWLQYFRSEGLTPKYSRKHFRRLKSSTIPTKAKIGDILRHTAISNLVKLRGPKGAQLFSLSDVATQMGTSEKMIQRHYLAQISNPAAVEEFWSLVPASFGLTAKNK